MKKIFLATVVMAASMFSFNASAQKSKNCPATCPDSAACPALKCDRPDPFIGITLTPEQQTKLQTLKAETKAKRQAMAKDRKTKVKTDRTKRAEAMKASKKEYLENVKKILGPDQYVVFLENIVLNQPSPKAGMHHDKRGATCKNKDMKRPGHKHHSDRKAAPAAKSQNNAGN